MGHKEKGVFGQLMLVEVHIWGTPIASIMLAKLAICFENLILLVLTILTKFVSGSTKNASMACTISMI